MIAFTVGLITGFFMSIPIGPINVMVINTQIKKNSAHALAIALGGSVMDFFYFFVILSGLSLFSFSQNMKTALQVGAILLIFILGAKEFFFAIGSLPSNLGTQKFSRGRFSAFFWGVVIYVCNPTLIVTITGLGAFIKSLSIFEFSRANVMLVSLGVAFGGFAWFVLLGKIVAHFEGKIRMNYLTRFNKISGLLMVSFAIYMGVRLLSQI